MGEQLVLSQRYRGVHGVAHGGYVAGLLAKGLDGPAVEVALRRPPPLDQPMTIERDDGRVILSDTESAIAQARPATLAIEPPRTVSLAEAEEASRLFPGHSTHPFPSCFVCGPEREPGDGLRLFPGRVGKSEVLAAPFVPVHGHASADGEIGSEIAWAAFDCPQLWALMNAAAADSTERVVTSRLTGAVTGRLRVGERYVVVSWPAGREDDRLYADAAILTEAGETIAVARQTAVAVEGWGVPLGRDAWGASAP